LISLCSGCRKTKHHDYIKRVIGLPGDRIQMKDGLLYINERPVQRERLSDFIGEDPCGSDTTARVKALEGDAAERRHVSVAGIASTTAFMTTPMSNTPYRPATSS